MPLYVGHIIEKFKFFWANPKFLSNLKFFIIVKCKKKALPENEDWAPYTSLYNA